MSMQYIAHSDTDIRAARQMMGAHGETVAAGLVEAGEVVERGLRRIACSNKEIAEAIKDAGKINANAILEAGQLIETGLAQIADEMRRKTYTEEYYLLLDRIDSLEDKIVAKGGKLQEIYDSLGTEYISPIDLSFPEILTMWYYTDKDSMSWFKIVASTYKVNPWNVFVNVLGACDDQHYCLKRIGGTNDYPRYGRISAASYEDVNIFLHRYCEEDKNALAKDNSLRLVGEEDKEYVKDVKAFILREEKYIALADFLSKEDLEYINAFNAFINGINVGIMMENIRLLHTELREVYRQMK